jgi:hypothetical protein
LKDVLAADGHPLMSEVDNGSRRDEVGSWVIASAAFMLIAFRQTYVVPALPLSLSPARLLLFGGACVFVIACLAGRKARYRVGVLGPVLLIYFMSTLTAYGIGMTQESIPIKTVDYYLVAEILLILAVIYYFNVVHSYTGLSRIIKALVAGGVVSAVFAILAHGTGADLAAVLRPPGLVEREAILNHDLVRGEVVRPQGSAGHPLEFAAVLTIIFPLAVGLTYSLRAECKRWLPWAMASVIIVIGVAVSVSRSALIGLFAAFVVMALFWPIRRTLLMIAGVLCLAVLVFLVNPPLFEAYSSTLGMGTDDPSAQFRLAAARYILSHFTLFGSFGQGGGTDNYVFDDQYLYRLSETGMFGLLAYVLLLGTSLVLAIRAFLNVRHRKVSGVPAASAHLFLGLTASLTAYAVMNIVLDVGGFVQIWTTMWLLVATSAVAYRISCRPDSESRDRAPLAISSGRVG